MNENVLIAMLIIFIYIFLFLNRRNVIYVESNSGMKFLLHKDNMMKDKTELFSLMVENMLKLKNHLVKNKENFPQYKKYLIQLEEYFDENRTTIYETDPSSNLTSYSINKGEELSFCLKSKKTGKLHDINLLMYVAIHEMAHVACPEIGHGNLFKKIFRFFCEEAINIGLYKKDNYDTNPVEYCGMILSSSII
jgi:predicted metal-dependent hydrolase